MRKIFLLFSHNLTDEQVKELKDRFGICSIISLPKDLQNLWSNFPPENDFPEKLANIFIKFLKENSSIDDFVLIQGEFGLVFYMVDWCLKNRRIPIYSTTKRIFKEENQPDGSIKNIHIFKHINFRKYRGSHE
jgi:hypothetical protein